MDKISVLIIGASGYTGGELLRLLLFHPNIDVKQITSSSYYGKFTFIITTFSANKNYWKHIFWMPGVPVPMKIFLIPIELIGMLVKPMSLMIRLFANITAGHIIILALMSLIFIFETTWVSPVSIGFSLFIGIIEIVVTAIQAYIFTVLSALYFLEWQLKKSIIN